MSTTEQLTDEEREAVEAVEAEAEAQTAETQAVEDDEAKADDRPWLDEARSAMRDFLTDEELAALSEDGDDDKPSEAVEAAAEQAQEAEESAPAETALESPAPPAADLSPDDIAALKADTQAKLDALVDQYDEGDLTREQLREKQAEILRAEEAAIASAREAKAVEIETQRAERFVQAHIEAAKTFLAANPALGQDKAVLGRFDVLQQQVQNDPAFEGKDSMAIFAEAKARLADEARRAGKTIPGITESSKRPTHITREIPPNISGIPAAAQNQPEGSRLGMLARQIEAAFDAGDPVKAERLMARLSPEDQDAILQGAI